MSSAPSSRGTHNIYFMHIKVNILLYVCLLGTLMDGILLAPPPLCMYRFEWCITRVKEEFKHESTTTPSKREAMPEEEGVMEGGVQILHYQTVW